MFTVARHSRYDRYASITSSFLNLPDWFLISVRNDSRTLVLQRTLGRRYHIWLPLPLVLLALQPALHFLREEWAKERGR